MIERLSQRRGRRAGTAFFCLAATLGLGTGRASAAVEVRAEPRVDSGQAQVRIENQEVHLTLAETVALALERNLGLRIERFSRQQLRVGVQEAMGIYDLGLSANASIADDESPSASNLEGAQIQKQKRAQSTIGISRLLPTGGTAQAAWGNSRLETNSQFFSINPSYNSGLDVTLAQPLLRNFGRDATEFDIRVAEIDSEIAREVLVERIVATIVNAENAYWNLVAARFRLRVVEESLGIARQLHDNNRVRVDVGTLAPLELVSSESGIATRDEEIIRARAAIGDAEDVLRYLLDLDDPGIWSLPVIPDTEAATDYASVEIEQSLAAALENRPELARQELALRSRELASAFFRGQTKPRLDLVASYGYNGVGGDVVVRDEDGNVISRLPGGWDDALNQVVDRDFAGWSVGLEFGYPLQNRAARARSTIADLALDQTRVAQEELRQRVEAEVRVAVRGLETTRQQIESARATVTLAQRNLDAERRKYENGLSTSFQILEVEEDLTAARSRQVDAVTAYRRALVEYHRALGGLLAYEGVTFVD